MYSFQYHKPATLEEAQRLLESGEESIYLAGGQTLIPTLKQRLAAPTDVIDLADVDGMDGIEVGADAVSIGAMTRHADVASSAGLRALIPALAVLAGGIGDAQVRNRGTLGGSVANSDPAADYPAAVVGLGATVHTSARSIAGDEFFEDLFETALDYGEIITRIEFPIPTRAAYCKFPNPASRYAVVGVFVADFGGTTRVAVTGAGPCAFRATDMEAALASNLVPAALDGVEIDYARFNSDLHASAEYRGHLVRVMAKRAVEDLLG
jgi:carbon-monoxide dehydrogenase medium subunit